jgi:hypothetical protein
MLITTAPDVGLGWAQLMAATISVALLRCVATVMGPALSS